MKRFRFGKWLFRTTARRGKSMLERRIFKDKKPTRLVEIIKLNERPKVD